MKERLIRRTKKLSISGGVSRKMSDQFEGEHYRKKFRSSYKSAGCGKYEDDWGDSSEVSVNFLKLSSEALQRYCEYYNLDVDSEGSTKDELAESVGQHFAAQKIDEFLTVTAFLSANSDRRREASYAPYPSSSEAKSSHKSSHSSHSLSSSRPHSASVSPHSSSRKKATTYGDMIAHALRSLPKEQGTLEEICSVIEKQFWKQLNHELESGPRKIPVWKASVRKIINLNYGMRFQRTGTDSHGKAVFGFAPN